MSRILTLLLLTAGPLLHACEESVPQPALADLSAKPAWGASVPQLADMDSVFEMLSPTPVPFHGTLVCRVRASEQRQWDPAPLPQHRHFIPPDLVVAAELPGDST